MQKILECSDLEKTFSSKTSFVRAVDGVSLSVERGECYGLVGESGSGKSVTVKTIMGILDSNGVIDSGQIIYRYPQC